MPLSIDEQIKGLGDTISSAQWHFDVWEGLEEARADQATVDVLNKYLEFFRATTTANFESYIIACYQLLETKDDRICFPSLKTDLVAVEKIDVDSVPELVELQRNMKPIWVRISKIRNESVGHLSKSNTPAMVYVKAGLTGDLMREFISNAKDLYNGITHMRDGSVDAFNVRGKPALEDLLADLRGKL